MSRTLVTRFTVPSLMAIALACPAAAMQSDVQVEHQITGPNFDSPYPYFPEYQRLLQQQRQTTQNVQPTQSLVRAPSSDQEDTQKDEQTEQTDNNAAKAETAIKPAESKAADANAATEQKADEGPRTSYQFGTNRVVPNYQPGNAQNEFNTGQPYNQERAKKTPSSLRNHPSWQDGHFLTQPGKTIKQKPAGQ